MIPPDATGAIRTTVAILPHMLGSDRRDLVTTDLLSEWTDPDTAMEAVGTSLGLFGDRIANPRTLMATDSPLKASLYDVLLSLVAGGALETRRCADGRYAFRWRDEIGTNGVVVVPPAARDPDPVVVLVPEPVVVPDPEPVVANPPPAETPEPLEPAATKPTAPWWQVVTPTAPLVFPAASCVLALLVFVFFDRAVAVLITFELAALGVFGLVRRVPFAALWTIGLVVAGILVRFS